MNTEDFGNLHEDKFREGYQQERAKRRRPTVLISGYTGCGKSSLIRAVCGNVVPLDVIGDGRPKTMGFDKYETEDICVYDSRGLEIGDTEEQFTTVTRDFVRKRQEERNVDNHIHLVWYAIQGCGARVTDCDINLIRNIFDPDNVIVVITKKDITRPNQLDALINRLAEAGVPKRRIIATSDENAGSDGCRELMEMSYEMLPEAYRDAFVSAQQVDIEKKVKAIKDKKVTARKIIVAAATAAAAVGAIPIPGSDAPLLMGEQALMIGALAGVYGFDKGQMKQVALPMLARVGGMMMASSLVKLIPFAGSVIQAGVAGLITTAMGWFVADQFEKNAIAIVRGEAVSEFAFDPSAFVQYYEKYKTL